MGRIPRGERHPYLARRLRDDPGLRAEVEAARAWGVPRGVFLGRPLPGPGEPLWLDEDRAWALALLEYEAGICPGCGRPRSETTDAAMQDQYDAQAIRCHGCAAVAHASQLYAKNPEGLYFHVVPRDTHRR